jgi:hypothetical protein
MVVRLLQTSNFKRPVNKHPLYPPEFQQEIDFVRAQPKDTIHTIYRDYDKDPVQYVGWNGGVLYFFSQINRPQEKECPINCANGNLDIGGTGPYSKGYDATMENTGTIHFEIPINHIFTIIKFSKFLTYFLGSSNGGIRHISANTHLYSDVVMQYFSWAEYDFMQKPEPKVSRHFLPPTYPRPRTNFKFSPPSFPTADLNIVSTGFKKLWILVLMCTVTVAAKIIARYVPCNFFFTRLTKRAGR